MGLDTSRVDEYVCVGHDAGDGAGHVVVDLVHFLGVGGGLEKLGGDFLLADGGACVTDGFHCVLDLVETAFWGEDCGAAIVSSRHVLRESFAKYLLILRSRKRNQSRL